jgi:hypothetical protein
MICPWLADVHRHARDIGMIAGFLASDETRWLTGHLWKWTATLSTTEPHRPAGLSLLGGCEGGGGNVTSEIYQPRCMSELTC